MVKQNVVKNYSFSHLSFGVFRFGNEIVIHASDATVDETVGETEADHDEILHVAEAPEEQRLAICQ